MTTLLACQLSTLLDHLESSAASLPRSTDPTDDTTAVSSDKTDQQQDDLFSAQIDHAPFQTPSTEDDWFLAGAELAKLAKNTDLARDAVLAMPAVHTDVVKHSGGGGKGERGATGARAGKETVKSEELKLRLADVNAATLETESVVRRYWVKASEARAAAAASAAKTDTHSDLNEKAAGSSKDDNNTEKQSLFGDLKDKAEVTFTEKLHLNHTLHSTLSNDILSLVRTLKQDALSFSEKLAADANVLDSTARSLERSSGAMGRVGSRLGEYRRTSALGWWFYVVAVLGIVAAVIGGMIIIKLFPKW